MLSLPAASNLAPSERWTQCSQAINDDNVEAFKQHFTQDLLGKFTAVRFSNSLPTVRPFGLMHLAAASKKERSGEIITYMIQHGFDPNTQQKMPFQEKRTFEFPAGHGVEVYNGRIGTLLPLDIAVMSCNISGVKALLENGADSYETSFFIQSSFVSFLLKRCISKRFGESPLSHARACAAAAHEGSQNDVVPGTQEEYQEIVKLLQAAQFEQDLESCSIQ